MDAVGHLVSRAVESPRYALPAARRCIAVVEREQTETFLESLLNTCQQWYHDRDKVKEVPNKLCIYDLLYQKIPILH